MVDWLNYKFGDVVEIFILDNKIEYSLTVKVDDFEYNLHRHPHLVDLKVIKTNNDEVYPIGSVLRLPVDTKDDVNFLLFAPNQQFPNRELKRTGVLFLK
jgi:hypothetical protein